MLHSTHCIHACYVMELVNCIALCYLQLDRREVDCKVPPVYECMHVSHNFLFSRELWGSGYYALHFFAAFADVGSS